MNLPTIVMVAKDKMPTEEEPQTVNEASNHLNPIIKKITNGKMKKVQWYERTVGVAEDT